MTDPRTMETIYSPSNIEVLLHCHTCPRPHPRLEAGAVKDAIMMFLHLGAIEPDTKNNYKTTPMGKAWVQALCNVRPPRPAFVDESGNVLE